MTQGELFFDSIYDAIGNAIESAGGYKFVSGQLWKAKKTETAYARLKSCVDEHKDEKLDAEEILLIARMAKEKGNHALMQYMGQELGYSVQPLEPEDELTGLLREYMRDKKSSEEKQSVISQRIERAIERLGPALRSVK